MYEEGSGVPQDFAAALIWYRKAADQGDADAQFYLGGMYDNGKGVPQDYAAAVTWICKRPTRAMPGRNAISGSFTKKAVAACRRTITRPRASTSSPQTRETPNAQGNLGFFY